MWGAHASPPWKGHLPRQPLPGADVRPYQNKVGRRLWKGVPGDPVELKQVISPLGQGGLYGKMGKGRHPTARLTHDTVDPLRRTSVAISARRVPACFPFSVPNLTHPGARNVRMRTRRAPGKARPRGGNSVALRAPGWLTESWHSNCSKGCAVRRNQDL